MDKLAIVHSEQLRKLNAQVTRCKLCPRLTQYIRQVGQERVKRFAGEKYWARPVPRSGVTRTAERLGLEALPSGTGHASLCMERRCWPPTIQAGRTQTPAN